MSNLYDTDEVTWAEQQAALLRRIAAGEPVNDQVDSDNVVEEIEDVRGRERDKVTEALVQALRHKLYLIGWPHSTALRHWEAEARIHLATARRRFRNSMRQYMTPESWQEDYQSALLETASHMADSGRRRWLCRRSAPGHWTSRRRRRGRAALEARDAVSDRLALFAARCTTGRRAMVDE